MNFVHDGVAGGDGQGGDSPGPMPAFASATESTIEKETKNKVLGEVRAFANEMVNEFELMRGQMRKKPFHEERQNRRGVVGRKGVRRECKDDTGPDHGRPPGAQPFRNQQLMEARLHLRQLRGGAGIAQGLFRHGAFLG